MIKFFIFFILLNFLLGCKKNTDCLINYYISGTVTDSLGTKLPNVEVRLVDQYNYDSKQTETDNNGSFSYFLGSYSDVGNTYIYFKKNGYKDIRTPAIGKGNESCGDQQIVRDATMETL